MMKYTLLIDNGHGKNTPGKRSPLLEDGSRFYEWEYSRDLAQRLQPLLEVNGVKCVILVPEEEDIALHERANRANRYKKAHPDETCLFMSIHGNAAGNGGWMNARGWSVWTTRGQNNSDKFAECLWNAAKRNFPERIIRADKSDGDHDYESNFTVIYGAAMPAVLVECWFYDNKEECKFMSKEDTKDRTASALAEGVLAYIGGK